MRKLIPLCALALIVGMPGTAQAKQTGEVCNTYSHNGHSQTICIGVDSLSDGYPYGKVHAYMSGSGGADRVDVDYVKLWRVCGGTCYALEQSNLNSGYFDPPNFVWTTPWEHGVKCDPEWTPNTVAYHADGQFRIRWPDGVIGPWRQFNSIDHDCNDG